MYNRIKKAYKKWKKRIKILFFLRYPLGKKIYILGTPVYNNLGDSAIMLAQKEFLKKSGIAEKRIKEITYNEYYQNRNLIKKIISSTALICGMGGGNMGNVWKMEEMFRYDIFLDFQKNPIIIFPQTIYFTIDEKGMLDKKNTISYYNKKKKLVLIAREKESYKLMKSLYINAKIILTPDIVLSTNKSNFNIVSQNRQGVLICARNDLEKKIDDSVWRDLENELLKLGETSNRIDMYADEKVTKENRKDLVTKKMQEFASAKLVITDRLHGMVFSAITETPCVVFSNYNYKVQGTYEWIDNLSYIRYVDSIEEAKKSILELLKMNDCKYVNSHLDNYFMSITNVIKEYN